MFAIVDGLMPVRQCSTLQAFESAPRENGKEKSMRWCHRRYSDVETRKVAISMYQN
jgi:hypothetical protein